jgi:hypothetical protein
MMIKSTMGIVGKIIITSYEKANSIVLHFFICLFWPSLPTVVLRCPTGGG